MTSTYLLPGFKGHGGGVLEGSNTKDDMAETVTRVGLAYRPTAGQVRDSKNWSVKRLCESWGNKNRRRQQGYDKKGTKVGNKLTPVEVTRL